MKKSVFISFLISLICALPISAQQPIARPASENNNQKVRKKSLQSSAESLEKSLKTNNQIQQAKEYVNVGNELLEKNMPEKAEPYFEKAEKIFIENKKKKEAAESSRKLAISQEEQKKTAAAAKSYQRASGNADNDVMQEINANDADRLTSTNLAEQSDLSKKNAAIIDKIPTLSNDNPGARAAIVEQVLVNQKIGLEQIKTALKNEKISTETVVKTAQDATEKLIAANKQDDAIALNMEILKTLQSSGNQSAIIDQLLLLSTLLNQENINPEKFLQEAYSLSIATNNLAKSKASIKQLLDYYYQSGQTQKANELTEDFLSKIDSIIVNDSAYFDLKKFEQSEGRIAQLEKEKLLQNATIRQSRMINVILIIVALGALGFLVYAFNTNRKINIRNQKIALQSLRREMNPHFIFNSLNSINEYIVNNDERKANQFLTSYATLMRRVMDNNKEDFVPINVETEQLQKYLALEHLRFSDKFDYEINIDESLQHSDILIPNMIIQPYLENAIWHGLRYLDYKGKLILNLSPSNQNLTIKIIDNGIGIQASKERKTKHQKDYQSLGMNNTKDRISLINALYKTNITTQINSDAKGTIVTINIPLKKK